jgi:hypothetical protein
LWKEWKKQIREEKKKGRRERQRGKGIGKK